MTDETYQGWTNRETWCVALWLNNDQGLQEKAQDLCGAATNARHAGADLWDWMSEDVIPETAQGFVLDMLNASMSRVNWPEVAASFLEP